MNKTGVGSRFWSRGGSMADDLVTVVADPARPDWARLVLNGRVTIASATQLHDAALRVAANNQNVTVCCAGAEVIDVAAIQVLICLGRDQVRRGKQCDITNVPAPIGELFSLAGLGNGP